MYLNNNESFPNRTNTPYGLGKNTQHERVEKILGIDPGYVVNMKDTVSVRIHDNQFSASFECNIGDKEYIIILSGNKDHALATQQFPLRTNPLLRNNTILRDISRLDIHPNMIFTLLLRDEIRIIPTNSEFWKQFRNRIPSTHPLSLIPTF